MNDTTLMTESEEPLDESEKAVLKVNIQRVKMASGRITSWQTDGETMETVTDFILGGSKITPEVTEAMKLKDTWLLRRRAMTNPETA